VRFQRRKDSTPKEASSDSPPSAETLTPEEAARVLSEGCPKDKSVMSLLKVLEHRKCFSASVLRGNMSGHEHKRHQFSAPEHPTKVESGIPLQPLPGRLGVFNIFSKFIGKIAPFLGSLLMGKLDCGFNRVRLFHTILIGVIPLHVRLGGLL